MLHPRASASSFAACITTTKGKWPVKEVFRLKNVYTSEAWVGEWEQKSRWKVFFERRVAFRKAGLKKVQDSIVR